MVLLGCYIVVVVATEHILPIVALGSSIVILLHSPSSSSHTPCCHCWWCYWWHCLLPRLDLLNLLIGTNWLNHPMVYIVVPQVPCETPSLNHRNSSTLPHICHTTHSTTPESAAPLLDFFITFVSLVWVSSRLCWGPSNLHTNSWSLALILVNPIQILMDFPSLFHQLV